MAPADREDGGDRRRRRARTGERDRGVPRAFARSGDVARQGAQRGPARAARGRAVRGESRLRELVAQRFMTHLEREVLATGELAGIVERIAARDLDPYTA